MKLRSFQSALPSGLEDILNGADDFGLFEGVAPAKPKSHGKEDLKVVNFKSIVDFCHANNREPIKNELNLEETKLANWLATYRKHTEWHEQLVVYDSFGLLEEQAQTLSKISEPKSLEEIFATDDSGLFDDLDSSIFKFTNIKSNKEKNLPEEIATSKACEDFYRYEKIFLDIQKAIDNKTVMLEKFSKKSTASVEQVFILRGVLCYVDSIIEENSREDKDYNPRLRVIFANGTESDLLKLSLARALYKDPYSYRVKTDLNLFSKEVLRIENQPTGYIYILATESKAPALAQLKVSGQLVKIGYSAQEVTERIRNAENDKTYLEAPVRLLAKINCYNLNPQKFENLVHAFLYQQKLKISLISKDGSSYHPEEWFAIDRDTAIAVCEKIVDGSISNYRMDNVRGKLVCKS